jgi:hypothetical protein
MPTKPQKSERITLTIVFGYVEKHFGIHIHYTVWLSYNQLLTTVRIYKYE